jgi:hypothetical protein
MDVHRHRISQSSGPDAGLYLLLYRYFFFDWLFRDVNDGSALERAAAWRFNQEMGRYLPIYLRRWTILVVFSYAVGALLENWLAFANAAAFFYCVTSISLAMSMLIVRSWLGLRFG